MPDVAHLLERDLDWRRTEIAVMKLAIVRSEQNSPQRRALLRAAHAMLYAHFEGFCKYAWTVYLQSIVASGASRCQCRRCLQLLSLETPLRQLRGNSSSASIWEFATSVLPGLLVSKVQFDGISTDGNLGPDKFADLCERLGLPYAAMMTHRTLLQSLVNRRHEIAHGEKAYINDLSEYAKYESAVLDIVYELAVAIVEAIDSSAYLDPHCVMS
jgi:hypothetical protein